jgi:hypothetical protein
LKLEIDKLYIAQKNIQSIKHIKLIELVDILRNGKARLKPNVLPDRGGVYAFWWTGSKELLRSENVNRDIISKGPNQRIVKIQITDEWVFHRGETNPIPLYIGKTADSIKNRLSLHLQLNKPRILNIGDNALNQPRQTTSNQVRDRIDRMFLYEKDTRSLILDNIGLSYEVLDGDLDCVNRFYLEDRLIGELFPIFNVDIER